MPAVLKKREHFQVVKEKVFFRTCKVLQKENQFIPETDLYCSQFNKVIDRTTVE